MPKTLRQKRRRQRQRKTQRGGASDFNVPIRSFYPQNQYSVDPQRMAIVGGKRRNHSRKYLKKGGSGGLLLNFGATPGVLSTASAFTGFSTGAANVGQRFMV
jgi:hypothetical protein